MEQRQSSFRASHALEMEFRRRLRQVAQEIRRMTAIEQSETAIMEQLQRERPSSRRGREVLVWWQSAKAVAKQENNVKLGLNEVSMRSNECAQRAIPRKIRRQLRQKPRGFRRQLLLSLQKQGF